MNNNYFNQNPIARQISLSTLRLFENENVDSLIQKISDITLDTFKKIVFDIASTKNRNPDVLRAKITDIAGTTTLKNLSAKIKDYSQDAELLDPAYAEVKKMYIDGLNMITDALKRAVEVDPSLEAKIIDRFINSSEKLQKVVDYIASEMQKSGRINESLVIGFQGRIDKLLKVLVNLITDSKGKDAKAGYGRDWHRLFQTLEQKAYAIQQSKSLAGEKDRKALAELEKKVDTLSQEYYQYKIKASEMAMKKINDDDELVTKFGDVNDLFTSALDLIAKANTQEGIIEVKIREDLEERESKMNDKVFPIKKGDKDTDAKFKGSNIIASIQKALMNGFIPIKNILTPRGGVDGKYGTGTTSVIKSIQTIFGNKNVDGNLDRSLIDSILKLDQLSSEDKEDIRESLSKLRKSYSSVSESGKALSSSDFFALMEAMTYIDPQELEGVLNKFNDELENDPEDKKISMVSDDALAEKLAKLLRTKGYNKNAEADDFLREDGSLKGSYPREFVESWSIAIDNANDAAYFVEDKNEDVEGIYTTKRLSSTVNKPSNWPKYSEISGNDDVDINDFGKWYTSYWKNFAGVNSDSKSSAITSLIQKNSDLKKDAEKDMSSSYYDTLSDLISSKKSEIASGYLDFRAAERIREMLNSNVGDISDIEGLKPSEMRFIYNLFSILAGTITYDKKEEKWVDSVEYISSKDSKEIYNLLRAIAKTKSFFEIGDENEVFVYLNIPESGPADFVVSKTISPEFTQKTNQGSPLQIKSISMLSNISEKAKKHAKRASISNSKEAADSQFSDIYVIKSQEEE